MPESTADELSSASIMRAAAQVENLAALGELLRTLHRREARRRGVAPLTYRVLAACVGCSHGLVGEYLAGNVLPSVDRFDRLVSCLGATGEERRLFATARDRVEDRQRESARAIRRDRRSLLVPRQLPVDLAGFSGRDRILADLDALLGQPPAAPKAAVAVLSGTAGVGKTALAVHWAHRVASRFPDGQLFLRLRGVPSIDASAAGAAVRALISALGAPARSMPAEVEGQAALLRSVIADRRLLIVLDDAADEQQVRPLVLAANGCLTLVTSRNRMTGLAVSEHAQLHHLDLPTDAEARGMLAVRLGAERLAAEPAAVDRLITVCARLPLALSVIAGRATMNPTFPLAGLASEIESAGGRRLDALSEPDPSSDIRTAFSWSYDKLSDEAARLFRRLGLHIGPDFTLPVVTSLTGSPPDRTQAALRELARSSLLVEQTPGRYACHDLLRAYARELSDAVDPADDRRATQLRLLDHYTVTARVAAVTIGPTRAAARLAATAEGPAGAAAGGAPAPATFADATEALAWFDAERPALLAAIDLAVGLDLHAYVWDLAWGVMDVLDRRGLWHENLVAQSAGLAAARHLDDPTRQAWSHSYLGHLTFRLGRHQEAVDHFRQTLRLCVTLGDHAGQGQAHEGLGGILDQQGRYGEALAHAHQALAAHRAAGNRVGQNRARNGIAWCHVNLGQPEQALSYCRQAIAESEELGDSTSLAHTWDTAGRAHLDLGQPDEAVTCYHQALRTFRQMGSLPGEADTLVSLGDAHLAGGEVEAAHQVWLHAVAIYEKLRSGRAGEIRTRVANAVRH